MNQYSNDTQSGNTVTTESVKQHLSLGREPDANLNIINTNGVNDDNYFWPASWDGALNQSEYGFNSDAFRKLKAEKNLDSKSGKVYTFNANTEGHVTVSYDNLKNSSYITNDGTRHNISKIMVTYNIHSVNRKQGILIFSDPTDGIGMLNGESITLNDFKFFDDQGNQINFTNNTAYLAITSLNHHANNAIETVTSGNNVTPYALYGSSVSLHNGNQLYATLCNDNGDGSNGSWDYAGHNNKSWDEKGPYEYFGTGLLSLSGSNSNFTFSVQNPDILITDISGSGPWFTFTTVIPQTPAPQLQHAETHYHYNTTNVYANRIIFSIILLSSLTCNSLITCKYVF